MIIETAGAAAAEHAADTAELAALPTWHTLDADTIRRIAQARGLTAGSIADPTVQVRIHDCRRPDLRVLCVADDRNHLTRLRTVLAVSGWVTEPVIGNGRAFYVSATPGPMSALSARGWHSSVATGTVYRPVTLLLTCGHTLNYTAPAARALPAVGDAVRCWPSCRLPVGHDGSRVRQVCAPAEPVADLPVGAVVQLAGAEHVVAWTGGRDQRGPAPRAIVKVLPTDGRGLALAAYADTLTPVGYRASLSA